MEQNEQSKTPSQPEKLENKVLTQQIFHKSFFSKTRTQSLSSLDILTPADTEISRPVVESDQWTKVPQRKRQRESPETNKAQKQKKLDAYWLSQPTPTSNSFSELDADTQDENSQKSLEKPAKAPPLYVDRVSNIQPLIKMLDEIAGDNYEVKILRNEQVRIQPKTTELYTKIVRNLQDKNTEFYTYRPKQDRNFKVVLKNLHPSTDIEEIKDELNLQGHKVTNVWNVKQRNSKKPIPIFFIELEPNSNNKHIYEIKNLLHCRVIFEPPRPKREIPQCGNCQQYGHTKKYCFRKPKCIKCAGDHASSNCERKVRSDSVKCVLCDGNHPANYKGCSIYKELQKIKYPTQPPRPRQFTHTENQLNKTNYTRQKDTPSYKQVLISNKPEPARKQNFSEPQTAQTNNNDTKEIISTITQLMQQLTSVTNLLMEIMTKLSHSIP